MAQEYPEFASDFTGSLATLQENPCLDDIRKETPVDISCPTCTPNPSAVVPDWTTMRDREVFLNEKTCQYSVVIVTQYPNVGGTEYPERVAEWAPTAARELLRYYDKLETDLIVQLLVNGYEGSGPIVQATAWFVPLEPNSNLRLLFTINAFNFDGISSRQEDPQVNAPTTGATITAPNEIKLELASLQNKLDRLTKVLAVYGKFQASFQLIDNGYIYVDGTNREFILGSVKNETSLVYEFSQIDNIIDTILSDHNYEQLGTLGFSSYFSQVIKKADYITFGIDEQFQLKSITIHQTGCPDVIVSEERVKRYADEIPLNNPTIIAYLSRINEMYDEALAIEAPQWIEYLLKHTYPTLSVNYGAGTVFDDVESLAECIASAVAEYGNKQTNKLIDSLLSISDLVADRLNKYTCTEDGQKDELTAKELIAKEKGELFNKIRQSVLESETFKTYSIIQDFKNRMVEIKKNNNGKAPLNKVFDSILDDYGFCGLLGLIQAAIQCLVSGFSYEEVLKKIIKASLNNLTPLQVSSILVGLPPDKKAEVLQEVDSILKQNDLVSELFVTFDTAASAAVSSVTSAALSSLSSSFFDEDKQFDSAISTASSAKPAEDKETFLEKIQEKIQEAKLLRQTQINDRTYVRESLRSGRELQETFAPPDLNDFSDAGSDEDDEDRSTRERRSSSSRQRSGNGGSTATEEDFSFDNGTSTITVETKEGSVRTFIVDKELVLEVPEGISVSGTITGPSQTTIDQLNRQTNEYYDNILKQTPDSASKYRQQLGQNRVGEILGEIQSVVITAYIDALLRLVNAEELYAIILKFPGVKTIEQLVKATNCPRQDESSRVTWLNFLNTLEIEWCKTHFDITFPPFPVIPNVGAFLSNLWKALSQVIKELLIKLISKIFSDIIFKILEILLNLICSTLGALTEAALTGQNAGTAILDMLRESFNCPPLDNAEQELALLEAVQQIFSGQGISSGVSTQEVASYLQTTSTALTAYELVDLMKGKLSADRASYLKQVLRAREPRLASLFPNESSITSLFTTIGSLIPYDILNDFEDRATDLIEANFPANLSTCGTPQSIERFRNLREQILSGKGLSDEEIRQQIDLMENIADENLNLLTDLASKGLGNFAGETLFSTIYGSGTLTSPFSALQQDNCSTSPYNALNDQIQQSQYYANTAFFNSLKTLYLNDLLKEPTFLDFGKEPIAFLNAVLSDKNARDYMKHLRRTDDVFFPIYNSEEQKDFAPAAIGTPQNPQNNYFPITVANLTKNSLITASSNDIVNFSNNTELYTLENISIDVESIKRTVFGKREDYTLITNAAAKSGYVYNLLYSQFAINNNVISTDNIARLSVIRGRNPNPIEVFRSPDIELVNLTPENVVSSLSVLAGSRQEKYLTIYQSKFDLGEEITLLKNQYIPTTLVNSPQADCFISFMNSKIQLGGYSLPITVDINNFNSVSDKSFKFINTSLTNEDAYLFGYDYEKEKLLQDDIELDPETLERKTNNSRVVFLDHTVYGGTEEQPPVYIKPALRTGWLGVIDSIFPELTCETNVKVENIVNFNELQQLLSDLQSSLPDDPALLNSKECREVVPYLKPLSSLMAANLQIGIVATMRIYISEAILRCMPLYNKFIVSYGNVIDELYIDYIVRKMEDDISEFPEGIAQIKNDKYYLHFLEQCVQIISRKLIAKEITLTNNEQRALDSINFMIRDFLFVTSKDFSQIEQQTELILSDLRTATLEVIRTIIANEYENLQDQYNKLLSILNTRVEEYNELSLYAEALPIVYDELVASFDENGVPSLVKANQFKGTLAAILDQINTIKEASYALNNDMLRTVLAKLYSNTSAPLTVTLNRIREEMVLEGIRRTKIEAQILMRKILKDEFNAMSSNFAAHIYTNPTINNIHRYFLDNNEPLQNDTQIIIKPYDKQYFDVAADPSAGDHPLFALRSTEENSFSSLPFYNTVVNNQDGYFFLERYIRLQDREVALEDTPIPDEILNRPENINGVINVNSFRDWIATLPDEVKNTEMYKYFGDYTNEFSGSTLGVKYGLRLNFVPSVNNFSPFFPNITDRSVMEEKAYLLNEVVIDGTKLTNSRYVIPIINVETDLLNDTLANFDPDNGKNQYYHQCLVKEMAENDEFKFLFYYCVPLQKHMSAISVHITETYVNTIGLDDGWVSSPEVSFDDNRLKFFDSKRACKTFFELFYNWDDTGYVNTTLTALTDGPAVIREKLDTLLRPVGPLLLTKSRIIPRKPCND